jgi:hypothetical protein
MNQRLLRDAPRTIAQRVSNAARSGATLEAMEKLVRDNVSSHLAHAKNSAVRVLINAGKKAA